MHGRPRPEDRVQGREGAAGRVSIARAAALVLAASAAGGAAGEVAFANDVQSCRVRVQNGAASIELRQARDTATEVTGYVRPLCRAELSVTASGREPEIHAWKDIHATGDRHGVAILTGRVAGLVRVAKYGDGDGRLVLVAKDGRTLDVPGPEHVVQGRWLVSVGEAGRLAVVDTSSFAVTMKVEGAPAGGDDAEAMVARAPVTAVVRDGPELLVVLGGKAPAVLRLDGLSGRLVVEPGRARPEGPSLLRPVEWADCSCQLPAPPP